MSTAAMVTQPRVIKSEWIKFRSLRSSAYTLIASVGMTVGLGLMFAVMTVAQWDTEKHPHFDPVDPPLLGVLLAQLAIGTLGVMVITGEYTTGMIRASLTAVPRRLPVLWAKLAVFGVVATVVSTVSTVGVFLADQAILHQKHVNVALTAPGVARTVIGAGLYLAGVGLMGAALGFLIRNTAGAITTLFGIVLILPVLGELLPSRWATAIEPYLPSNAGQALMTWHPDANTLAPWTGYAVFLGYVAAMVVVGAILLRRRDA